MVSRPGRQTLIANLAQQLSSLVLMLSLPNLIDKESYSKIVYVSVLLSFMVVSDLGMSLVYGRRVPALIAKGKMQLVRQWDSSVLGFGMFSTIVFSFVIMTLFWLKYRQIGYAIILMGIPVAVYWSSFIVSQLTVSQDFSQYRRVVTARSVLMLVIVPLAWAWNLLGWFIGQIVALTTVLFLIGRKLLTPFGRIRWRLIRIHILEGLTLAAVTAAWMQLLNFGRIYASFKYSAETLAHYGVAGAAYQSISALLISIFLPVTVGILSRFGHSDTAAIEYIGEMLTRTVWWTLFGGLVVAELAPHLLAILYPTYLFDRWMVYALLLGIVYYPFFLVFGNFLVGKHRAGLYLTIVCASLLVALVTGVCLDLVLQDRGGAWGQLCGLAVLPLALLLITRALYGHTAADRWRRATGDYFAVSGFVLVYLGFHRILE